MLNLLLASALEPGNRVLIWPRCHGIRGGRGKSFVETMLWALKTTEKNFSNLQEGGILTKQSAGFRVGAQTEENLECLRQGTVPMIEVSENWELGRYYFRELGWLGFIHFSLRLRWVHFLLKFLSFSKKNSQNNGMNEEVSLQGLYSLFFLNTQAAARRDWKNTAFSLWPFFELLSLSPS